MDVMTIVSYERKLFLLVVIVYASVLW